MLVGRRLELEALHGLVGAGQPVVIVGPAGIGKSTLARAALSPFGRFREGGALASLTWSPLLVFHRLLQARPPELPASVADAVMADGEGPVLLDDLQWADDTSLETVALLVDQVPVVATVRTGEARTEFVLAALELSGFTRMDLGALADEPAAELAALLHPELDPTQQARLLAAASGNPLLLGELPRGADAAPGLVSALVGRLASLDAPARTAMERLAVLGRPALAEELGPGALDLVPAGLASLAGGHLTVHHSLLAEVIVDELGEQADGVRRELALAVGGAEAAHLLAAAGDRTAARERALDAAAVETDRRQRAHLLALAVRCAPDLDALDRFEAIRLFNAVGDLASAQALSEVDGRDGLDPVMRGALTAAEAETAWLQGRADDTADLAERALADLRGTNTAYEVVVLAGSTVLQTFVGLDGRPALERAREAVRLADELGVELGYAQTRLASVLLTAGEPGWSELYETVMERARANGDDHLRRTALTSLVLGRWVTGEAAVAEELAHGEVLAGPTDGFDGHWQAMASYAAILGLLGGRPRPELIAEFSPILEQWPSHRHRPFLEGSVLLALADSGRHPEGAALAAGAVARAGRDAQSRSIVTWARIDAAWLAGRLQDAYDEVEALLALGLGDYPSVVHGRLVGAHAARGLGNPLQGPAPGAVLPAWHAAPIEWAAIEAALEGRTSDAVAGFSAAASGWRGSDVRSEVRCRWAAGDVAVQQGHPGAVDLLLVAETRATELGLVAMLDRVRRSLRSAGVVRRARSVQGVVGLTGREEEVLALVEAGLQSGDIASALGIKASTVDSFVRTGMQKLGAHTRVGAAVRWRELRDAEDANALGRAET